MTFPNTPLPNKPRKSLDALFDPKSIAIIGATPNKDTFAGRLLTNLALNGYEGQIYLVNPKYDEIDGKLCYPSVLTLPTGCTPDAAMIMTGGEVAVRLLDECERAGVSAATIFAAGFGEAQAGGHERVDKIAEIIGRSGMRLCGPNTIGLANYYTGAVMLAARNVPPSLTAGPLAIVSQSGGIGYTMLNKAYSRRLPTGYMAVTGNATDTDLPDYVEYFASRDDVATIAIYFEALPNIRKLAEVFSTAVRNGKTVAVYRAGRSEVGSRMAASHTGVLTQGSAIIDELLASTGAITHDSLEDMFETAYAAVRVGRLPGSGVAITSTSGGCNVQGADKAIQHGLAVPQFSSGVVDLLRERYPFASPHNPYDPTGLWRKTPEYYSDCIATLTNDDAISATVVVLPTSHADYSQVTIDAYIAGARGTAKPVVGVYMTAGTLTQPFEDYLRDNDIPLFGSLDGALGAMGRLFRAGASAVWRPDAALLPGLPRDRREMFNAVQEGLRGPQNEVVSKRLLRTYGIDVVDEAVVRTREEAVDAARRFGFPVVMKKCAEGLIHKTEVGGVKLNLTSDENVRQCFDAFARDGEVIIQPQIRGDVEMIVGGRQDDQLGPVVVLGMGGIFTELLSEVACRMAPVSVDVAAAMLASLRGAKLLSGYRGSSPLPTAPLIDMVARLSWMLAENPNLVEIDLNPVMITQTSAVAVDAMIVLDS